MPLVVPGITSNNGDKSQDWQNQLMGKKLGETSDHQTFARKDLPKEARVVKQGDMVTMDHKPDRLNVHLGEDSTVTNVKYG